MTFETGHIQAYTKEYEIKEDFFPVQYPLEFGNDTLDAVVEKINLVPGVTAAFPRIAAYATLTSSSVKHAVVWGIDTKREFEVNNFNLAAKNNGLVEGRYPLGNENSCAISTRLAKKMELTIGDSIPLKVVSSQFSDRFWQPEIVGLFDYDFLNVDNLYILVPFEKLQRSCIKK